ncbi:Imm49 family immunity protein [Ectopseudomonas khazarica]|uniref:Imm49 family immunity protein n=1 Tax=Ectopseudomonas khazarica TaxID=2502979 RepID=UPI0037CBE3C3
MKENKETREERLIRAAAVWKELTAEWVVEYVRDYHKLKRGSALRHMTSLSEDRGLKCYFIDNDLRRMKQNFYVYCKLLMAAQQEVESSGDAFAGYEPFLYGLLSDSPEIYNWLAHAELKHKDQLKTPHFTFYQFQLALRRDDEALRETIALVARNGGNRNKALAQAGQDFFSLLLKQDKEGLQALIENQAKIKSVHELEGQFLAGFAMIHAKLCWCRGIEVQIENPLIPMDLLPIEPLDFYDVEYDFLRPGWSPPPPQGLFSKIKHLLSKG